MSWNYERGEGRVKHRWNRDYAGFEPHGKGWAGKCPNTITESLAEQLLNAGIPEYDSDYDEYPARIYTVYRGVVYEAVPTVPGVSYHGYPWRGDLPGRSGPLRETRATLRQLAESRGELGEYKRWIKNYGK